MINYIKEYYMKEEHDLTSILNYNSEVEEEEKKIKKQIKELQKQIEEKSVELHSILDKAYSKNYVPTTKKTAIMYENKNGNVFTFDLESGVEIETSEDYVIYHTTKKRDKIIIVSGYNYELGCIILKQYNYSIGANNDKMTTKLLNEIVFSFMNGEYECLEIETNTIHYIPKWEMIDALNKSVYNEFVNTMYGVEYKGNYTLKYLHECNMSNKSFEIILKQAPIEIQDKLLSKDINETLPIHKIMGISQETYNYAIENGLIEDLYNNIKYFDKNDYGKEVDKTEKELLTLLEEMKAQEEDLDFYGIDYNKYYGVNGLFGTLIDTYYISSNKYYGEKDRQDVLRKFYALESLLIML